jgi:hypothetical protein
MANTDWAQRYLDVREHPLTVVAETPRGFITEMHKGWTYRNTMSGRISRCLGRTPRGNYVMVSDNYLGWEDGFVVNESHFHRYTVERKTPVDEHADEDF